MESTPDETWFELETEALGALDEMSRESPARLRDSLRQAILAYRRVAQARELRTLPRGKWKVVEDFASRSSRFVVVVLERPETSGIDSLTPREREVLTRAASGESNKVIAYELGLSASTVRVLVARARAKLGAKSGAEAASIFARARRQ